MAGEPGDFFDFLMEANRSLRIEWFDFLNNYAVPGGIVIAGDSITQEFCMHEMAFAPAGKQLHNRGIGGDTTAGLLSRIDNSIILPAPSKVFILIGTNDLNEKDYNISNSTANMRKIAEFSRASLPLADIHILSILPTNPEIDSFTVANRTSAAIAELNNEYSRIAAEVGVIYIDLHRYFADEFGFLRSELTRDGLHLRPAGYKVLVDILMPYLK